MSGLEVRDRYSVLAFNLLPPVIKHRIQLSYLSPTFTYDPRIQKCFNSDRQCCQVRESQGAGAAGDANKAASSLSALTAGRVLSAE